MNSLENSLVDSSQLQDSLKEHIDKTNTALQQMKQETSQSVDTLGERIDKTASEVEKLTAQISQLEVHALILFTLLILRVCISTTSLPFHRRLMHQI